MTTPLFAAARPVPAHRRWLMLLRREVWEHRGSVIWAPLIVAGSVMVLLLLAVLLFGNGTVEVRMDFTSVNGISLAMLLDPASQDARVREQIIAGMNTNLIVTAAPVFVTLAFTVFFYCLGALYDDRRDRSVLFWASLPVPDTETVLSKVVCATVVAPTVAVLAAIGVMAASLLAQALLVLRMGGEPLPLLWLTTNPFRLILTQLAALPVYALWALPAVGWLLLCSAFARSKPFLWAVLVPLMLGVGVTLLDQFGILHVDLWSVWRDGVLRPFGNLFPLMLTWLDLPPGVRWDQALVDPLHLWRGLAHVQVWVGAVIGAGLIAAAIALRRWREAE